MPKKSDKNIATQLYEVRFSHVFKDLEIPAIESYVKEIDGSEVEIEFLTDNATQNDKGKNVTISGVVALSLSYLELSLAMPMEFQTYSKKTGKVVSPAAWMFHKGLTFVRRKNSSKTLKDLYGIWYVATQLGQFSEQAIDDFKILTKHNTQDSTSRLRKLNFEQIVKKLFTPSSIL